MKKLLLTLSTAGALSLLTAGDISAVKVKDIHDFDSAKYSTVYVYPQTTLSFQDKVANEINKDRKAKAVQVAIVYTDKQIAFNLKWYDETKSFQNTTTNQSFADGAAIQLPVNYKDGSKLPYIGMGSKGREVVVHLQKATDPLYEPNGNGDIAHQLNRYNVHAFNDEATGREDLKKFDEKVASLGVAKYQRSFISAGFRSMTQIKDGSSGFQGDMEYKTSFFGEDKVWSATFVRSLKDEYLNLNSDAFPLAIAVWDGEKRGRDGLKHLSSWLTVDLKGSSEKLTKEMNNVPGNIEAGKELAENFCSGCHRFGESNFAPAFMAPNLDNIGGYATPAYIKESIVHPNAVVVPGYNRNAHPATPWYIEDGASGRMSTRTSGKDLG